MHIFDKKVQKSIRKNNSGCCILKLGKVVDVLIQQSCQICQQCECYVKINFKSGSKLGDFMVAMAEDSMSLGFSAAIRNFCYRLVKILKNVLR